MKNLYVVCFLACLLSACSIPKVKDVNELAKWSDCDPARISYWVGQRAEYKRTKGWNTATECMAKDQYDCKCSAVIASEALKACGYETRIATIKGPKGVHAIALFWGSFTRGFIDNVNYRTFSAGAKWADIIEKVNGGPWKEI